MFKLDDDFTEEDLSVAVSKAERNYIIQVNDRLTLDVYTNKGERIVDPNNELIQAGNQNRQRQEDLTYLVKIDGTAKFPIIGQIDLDSLTLDQAETLLQEKYDDYYKDSFVKLDYGNKRVVVLGAVGGQIIPLTDENLSIVEIIALSGGIEMGAKAQNIKLIRGNLNKPEVYQINLSTVDGMRQSAMPVEPGDIIYVEPWRRPFFEILKDITPVMSMITSTLALILVLQNL
ncbi:MAG: polysaccharide biosynthesis/export family protein [Reichenbachiella sp.]